MKLFELTTTVDWDWVNDKVAMFDTPKGKTYVVTFDTGEDKAPPAKLMDILQDYSPESIVEINFELRREEDGSTQAVTGTGESATVFAAVLQIIKEYINENEVEAIYFAATTQEPSRVKLYDTLARKLSNSGWEVQTRTKFVSPLKWYIATAF